MESEHETDSSAEHPVTIETGLTGEQRAAIINRLGLVLVIAFFPFKWALDRPKQAVPTIPMKTIKPFDL